MTNLTVKPNGWQVAASLTFALILAATVIFAAGYYEWLGLLLGQVIAIAGPTAVPLLILPKQGRMAVVSWLVIAAVLIAGWSYVVYVDTRPYEGGGASFALLFGWLTCFVAFVVAALVRGVHVWWACRGESH